MLPPFKQVLHKCCMWGACGEARPDKMAMSPSAGINCPDIEEGMWEWDTYVQVPKAPPASMSYAAAPAGPSLPGSDAAPVDTTIIPQYQSTAAQAPMVTGASRQSADASCSCGRLTADLTSRPDSTSVAGRKPVIMASIMMLGINVCSTLLSAVGTKKAQQLEEYRAAMSQERANHAAALQELEACKAALQQERVNHSKILHVARQELDGCQYRLQLETAKAADLQRQLDTKTSKIMSLETELLQKQRDNDRINAEMDELECKVDKLERIGQDLMRFTGANPSNANMPTLKAALKELSTLTSTAAATVLEKGWGEPFLPNIISVDALDEQQKRPAAHRAALIHLLMNTVSSVVFDSFRQRHLLIETVGGSDSIDDALLCCQLKVEKQRAEAWLGLLQSSSAGSMSSSTLPEQASAVVQELTDAVIDALGDAQGYFIHWSLSSSQEAYSTLGPLLQPVVIAAMKAQAIVGVMHSRLLQLVVPGCNSNVSALSLSAPADWAEVPGMVVFDPAIMERGGSAAAVAEELQPVNGAPAALFCQEVGLVQLASSVKELSCAASQAAHAGSSTEGSQAGAAVAAAAVCKVLKKPRMFLAAN